jgi:hypothetical protein
VSDGAAAAASGDYELIRGGLGEGVLFCGYETRGCPRLTETESGKV